jgi:hypothetical protein
MRKDKLIELIKLNLGGGDVSVPVQSRYDPREIDLVVDMVYNDLIYAIYEAESAKGNTNFDALDPFGVAYKLDLQEDTDRKEWYVQLPFQMIPIPSSLGIRLVCPYTDQNSAYDIVDNNSLHTFSRLANQLLRPQTICYVEMPKIYFRYLPTEKPEHIMVKAISDFSSLPEDADVIIPGGNEVLFNKVADIFRRKGTKTLYNLNSDKQV